MFCKLGRSNDVANHWEIAIFRIFVELIKSDVRVSEFRKRVVRIIADFLILLEVRQHVV